MVSSDNRAYTAGQSLIVVEGFAFHHVEGDLFIRLGHHHGFVANNRRRCVHIRASEPNSISRVFFSAFATTTFSAIAPIRIRSS